MEFERTHPFNQFYYSEFEPNSRFSKPWDFNGLTFVCAEQFQMMCKAILFEDVQKQYLFAHCRKPQDFKHLGRPVSNFKIMKWIRNREEIVFWGNYFKFSQNPELKRLLLNTGNEHIYYRSPYDVTWGANKEKGLNLLGYALMSVRLHLTVEHGTPEYEKEEDYITQLKIKAHNTMGYIHSSLIRE